MNLKLALALKAFGLSLMLWLQPHAPWSNTYANTAEGQAQAIISEGSLFKGELGAFQTIALLDALAWFESRFNPHAIGDHGSAHGLYQDHNHGALEEDPDKASAVAIQVIKQSFKACHDRPIEERLGWYAAGGNDCNRGLNESRHRMKLAENLFKRYTKQGD